MTAEPPPPRKAWHLLGRAKLPITATLLVGFGGLVAVAVITVMLISILAARTNTEQLLKQAAKQRREAAIARIDRYLAPAADDVTFLAAQLSRDGGISLDDDSRIETLLRGSLGCGTADRWPRLRARGPVSSVRMRREETTTRSTASRAASPRNPMPWS